jgi:hypothetical protein
VNFGRKNGRQLSGLSYGIQPNCTLLLEIRTDFWQGKKYSFSQTTRERLSLLLSFAFLNVVFFPCFPVDQNGESFVHLNQRENCKSIINELGPTFSFKIRSLRL